MTKEELHNIVNKNEKNICQIVAYKNGIEVYNDTWNGFKKLDTCHVMSVTKSIVSLLIGIAIDKGLINSIDDYVLSYFPDYQIKRGEKTIQSVTIRHLLTMTAPYKFKYEPWSKICVTDDWGIAALDFLGGKKGVTGEFKYSTLGIHILTAILSRTSGMPVVDFANEYLFKPIGVAIHKNYLAETVEEHKKFMMEKVPKGNIWFCDPLGTGTAGYGLCFSAEDMAKIGQLCLNNGTINGKTIISKKWLKESTKDYYKCGEEFQNMSYGYLWWIINSQKHIYAAIGNSGNVIYINSTNNIVVSITGTFKPTIYNRIQFIEKYIEPFIISYNI